MKKEQRENLLKSFAGTVQGTALKEWLDEELAELRDITKVKKEKVMFGKQEAIKILMKLFNFLYKKPADTTARTDYK